MSIAPRHLAAYAAVNGTARSERDELIETYKAQARILEGQRSWISEMAQQVGIQEQRIRCYELIEQLTRKIQALQDRIAHLQ